jgi:hypothetical protein
MSNVELDGVLIVIFLKITDAPLRVMIVSFDRREGTGKGRSCVKIVQMQPVRFTRPAGRLQIGGNDPVPCVAVEATIC